MNTSRAPRHHSFTPRLHVRAEMVIDQHGVVAGWSEEAHNLLGFTGSEILGRPVAGLLVSDQSVLINEDEPKQEFSVPAVLRCKDGHTEACRFRIQPSEQHPDSWTVLVAPVPDGADAQIIDEAVLDALFKQSPASLCVYDTDLRLKRFNPAAEGMQGVFGEGSCGLRPHELWPDSNSAAFESVMSDVLATGVPHVGFEKRGRPPDDPEHEHIFANSIFRLEDPQGRVVGLATTAVEITEQRTAEERIALLADASALIGTSLDVVQSGQQLADISVPRFAHAATVDVFTPVISGEEPDPVRSELRRVGFRHEGGFDTSSGSGPASQPRFPYPLSKRKQLSDGPRRGEVLLPGDDGEPLYRGTSGQQPAHFLEVPLRARQAIVGVATFYRIGPGSTPFSDFDLLTARDLASRAALSIDNARRYTREHGSVRALQRQLLPHQTADQSAVETAHYFVPATSEANWFDIIPVSGARVALVVGTTDEPGLSGAAAIGRLGAAVHALADLDLSPDEVLARLDTLVTRITGERDAGARGNEVPFRITCVYAIYDPASGRLSLASAGHALPVAAQPDGSVETLSAQIGAPLGSADRHATAAEYELPAGSTLAFYTSPTAAGEGSPGEVPPFLIGAMQSAAAGVPVAQLRNQVAEASPEAVLLFARTQRLDDNHMSTWDLPSDPAVVATARSLVQRQLATWGLEETAFVTELVVSELVTNAIRYADGPIHMRVIRDHHALICEVSDATTTAPHLRYARSGDEGGRGLFLIAQLTQRWGTRFSDTGKTIWTEQEVESGEAL
ncbi:SpoIIE family protein phosphatase [Streptomyces sp. NPDC051098]|uniref:SpoIIE family protein phosphatase n=1 Tax=Streptomyces sp. NPDC051098 TaxID=3155411 RepID=UPI0034256C58